MKSSVGVVVASLVVIAIAAGVIAGVTADAGQRSEPSRGVWYGVGKRHVSINAVQPDGVGLFLIDEANTRVPAKLGIYLDAAGEPVLQLVGKDGRLRIVEIEKLLPKDTPSFSVGGK